MEKLRILAVDDNMVNLATLEQELKDEYEVIPVSSGKRAIKFLYIEKVDLILLDVQMPMMDGIETLKEIRTQENGITVPVILLTAKKDKTTVIEGSKLGIMDYIVKPVNSDELHERVKRALKRRGVLPMEGDELYRLVKEVLTCIQSGKLKSAVMKIDEIMGYQIDEAVSGRVHAAKVKLQSNDLSGGESMIQRVLKLMERDSGVGMDEEKPTISLGELNSRLLYILDDLKNFEIKEAAEKIDSLMRYSIPQNLYESCQKAQERLEAYDDDEAEKIMQEALKNLGSDSTFFRQQR